MHPRLAGATYFLETPGMDEGYDAINIARALELAAGRALEPLPPEAFAMTRGQFRARSAPASEDAELDADLPGDDRSIEPAAARLASRPA